MIEGWHNNDYLILFENQDEETQLTQAYSIQHFLPGYSLVGLSGWDDFIVRDGNKRLYTVPTVPLDSKHLKPFGLSVDASLLRPDERLKNKEKWYIKPIIFGGDANAGENLTWISLQQHVEAVKYWNKIYSDLKKGKT